MLSGPVLCKWCHLTLSEQLARAGARKVAEIRPNAMSRGRRWRSFSVLEDPMSMSRGDPLPWRFVVRYGTALLLAARWAARTAGYRRTANPRGQPAPGCCAGFSFWPSQWAVLPLSRWRRWRTAPATPTAVSPSVITGCTRPGTPASGRCRSEEHTSELQSQFHLVCRLLLEKKKKNNNTNHPQKIKKRDAKIT